MLMFDVLYGVVGQDRFNSIIGGYYREYASGGATTDDFVRYSKRVSHTNLDRFFDDWIYTARWYDRIAAGATVPDLVRYYRSVAP
jgi:aminopeptidase N